MITLLFKLIFGILGALLGFAWWMLKIWVGVVIAAVLVMVGILLF